MTFAKALCNYPQNHDQTEIHRRLEVEDRLLLQDTLEIQLTFWDCLPDSKADEPSTQNFCLRVNGDPMPKHFSGTVGGIDGTLVHAGMIREWRITPKTMLAGNLLSHERGMTKIHRHNLEGWTELRKIRGFCYERSPLPFHDSAYPPKTVLNCDAYMSHHRNPDKQLVRFHCILES